MTNLSKVYLDTNALRALSFQKHITPLLHASSKGLIKLYLSECVIWERARQYYETEIERERFITETSPLPKIVAWFRKLFDVHKVIIIETSNADMEIIATFLEDKSKYFNDGNTNDRRDALIFAAALSHLTKHDTIILCEDTKLGNVFEQEGYTVTRDAKRYVEEITSNRNYELISGFISKPDMQSLDDYQVLNALSPNLRSFLKTSDHTFSVYERDIPVLTDKLGARLHNMQTVDVEIRKRALGYAQWFSPIRKEELKKLLELRQYSHALIENCAQRLHIEKLLIDTGNHWLPNISDKDAKEICAQAMASVMSEILEIIGSA